MTRAQRSRSLRAAGALALALAAGGLIAAPCLAQQSPISRSLRFGPIDGRSFAGIALPLDAQDSDLEIRAVRASAWREGATQRLLLERDVVITLGPHFFAADRAVVWVEPVGGGNRQFALYLDNARDPRAAPTSAFSAPRLLVTGVMRGSVGLKADLLSRTKSSDQFVSDAESRLARHLRELLEGPTPPTEAGRPGAAPGAAPGIAPGVEPAITVPPQDGSLPPAEYEAPTYPREGRITFYGRDRTLVTGEGENAIIVEGDVAVQFLAAESDLSVQLSAERAVAFLEPGAIEEIGRLGPEEVRGVYLEGNVVATDGQYTMRGRRVYYDVRNNRAIILDGVFWTYDRKRAMPMYVRAEAIRQVAENQWSASNVRMSNSSFFEPHFAIGAREVTITRTARAGEPGPLGTPGEFSGADTLLEATGASVRVGGAPVIPLPDYKGDLSNPPLKRVDVEGRDGQPALRTTWDLLALAGQPPRDGLQVDLLADAYFARGPAVGTDIAWSGDDSSGELFGYYIYDSGRDDLSSGAEIERDGESRGMALFEHVWRLNEDWTLFLEATYVSDPAFVDAFFPALAESRREFTSSAYLRRTDENTLLSFEARGNLNDFAPNEYLLQSPGYQTKKLPEITYSRVGDSLLDGFLSFTSQTSYSRVGLSFIEPEVREFGYDTTRRSQAAFGLNPTDSLADPLRAAGLSEEYVNRFDTRHEMAIPLDTGALSITPFAVGRFTAYDDDFESFSPDEDDTYRLFGAGGLRVSSTIQKIDDSVRSNLFDLNRIRHLIEPSATLWYGYSTIDQTDLPVFDNNVESLADGAAMRAGLTSTWQTYRGGPGREYMVDWLTLRADYVWASDEVDRESPVGRWIESAPELSNLGEFVQAEALWQTTDAMALSGLAVYSMDTDRLELLAAGALFDHTPNFSTFVEVRSIEARQSVFVDAGARYDLSAKWSVGGAATYDADGGEMQQISALLQRRITQWEFDVSVGYDRITGDTSFGMAFRPIGASDYTRSRLLIDRVRGLHNMASDPVFRDASNADARRFNPLR